MNNYKLYPYQLTIPYTTGNIKTITDNYAILDTPQISPIPPIDIDIIINNKFFRDCSNCPFCQQKTLRQIHSFHPLDRFNYNKYSCKDNYESYYLTSSCMACNFTSVSYGRESVDCEDLIIKNADSAYFFTWSYNPSPHFSLLKLSYQDGSYTPIDLDICRGSSLEDLKLAIDTYLKFK